jgi:hypothetical protein
VYVFLLLVVGGVGFLVRLCVFSSCVYLLRSDSRNSDALSPLLPLPTFSNSIPVPASRPCHLTNIGYFLFPAFVLDTQKLSFVLRGSKANVGKRAGVRGQA